MEILRELKECYAKNRAGIPNAIDRRDREEEENEPLTLEPWWERRLQYLQVANRPEVIKAEKLLKLCAIGRRLARTHNLVWWEPTRTAAAAA